MAGAFPGGFITKSPVATVGPGGDFNEGGTASGMWTLDQALALKSAGVWPTVAVNKYLWAWGQNGDGNLGGNNLIYRSSPVQVGTLPTWLQISAGQNFSAAIKTDGTMWLWGRAYQGRLGDNTNIYRSSPVQIGALTTWSKIAAGQRHSMALKTDGTMWLWGNNEYGKLGDNTRTYRSSPIQVGALTTWSQIATGDGNFNLAIKTDGTLWAWGGNNNGHLGDGTAGTTHRSSPVQIGALTTWSKIAAGKYHSMAVKTDGTMWTWGQGQQGNVGDGTGILRSSPVQVGALTTWALVAGKNYTSMAIKTDGTLWGWGYNEPGAGALGDNTVISRSSPVQIGALTTWSKIAAGLNHCLAVKTDGTMWTWGLGSSGRLGGNTTISKSSPVQIGSLTSWRLVSGGENHSMAIALD